MSYYIPSSSNSSKHLSSPTSNNRTLPIMTQLNGQQNYQTAMSKQNNRKTKFNRYQNDSHLPESINNIQQYLEPRKPNYSKYDKYKASVPISEQYEAKINNPSLFSYFKPKQYKEKMSISMQVAPKSCIQSRSHQQCNQQIAEEQFWPDIQKQKQRKGSFHVNIKKYPRASEVTIDSVINELQPTMKRSHMVEKYDIQQKNHLNASYKKKVESWKRQDRTNISLSQPTNTHKSVKSVKYFDRNSKKMHQFIILRKLGQGTFGQVSLVVEAHTGAIYALKAISKQNLKSKQHSYTTIFRQIKIQLYLDHPNIVKLYHVFSDFDNIYLVLEVMDGNLYDRLQYKTRLDEKEVAENVYSLMKAVNCLHKQKIIHRDLKLQNIMLCNKVIKLGDFGCAIHTMNLRNTKIGSFAYHSPQQLKEDFYNEKVDVWGIGIITYELLFGQTPYDDDIMEILQNGAQTHELSELTFPQNITITPSAKQFILKMLEKNYKKRLNLPQAMIHQFIKTHLHESEFH